MSAYENSRPPAALDARIVELLERIARGVEGVREDLQFGLGAPVPASHGQGMHSTANENTTDVILTSSEVAKLLQIDERTIRTHVSAGDFPKPFYVGCSPRWRRSTIDDWIDAGGTK